MSQLCDICPRHCRVPRSRIFSADDRVAGVCQAPQTAVVARAGLHYWEEPVISGERGSGTVFFAGCNLKCVYCQNFNISSQLSGKAISVERLQAIYQELIAAGAHNINLVTPTHYSEVILESLQNIDLAVPLVYNTNSYDSISTLKRFENKVNIYLADYKYIDNALAQRYSAAADYAEVAWDEILEMYRQVGPYKIDDNNIMQSGVIIRHLILPGAVENSLRIIRRVAETFQPGEVLFSLMRQYIPCGKVSEQAYPELNRQVTDEEYQLVEDMLFASGIEDGFVQDGSAASGEFIPCFDGSGV